MDTNEECLRQGFKSFNRFMILLWRLGLGAWVNGWPTVGGRIMVLTHTGRKSGMRRRTPVNYAEIDGALYCTAGFGPGSDWYRNLLVNPQVEVWLPQGWWAATAADVTNRAERLSILRQVLINSGFAARAAGIDPVRMSDVELRVATSGYRLVQIQRTAACTGRGGPGELAWIWPLLTLGLLLYIWLPKKRG
ncbi:MAG: nitroreductase family deazaflavin-dependent oxidoreductase [Caldilinea sp. CFX5]|nr:nitroreductase family deazaflavin-dependent oxidoreductase [Caldilinea sp. CFX5]